MGAKGKFRSTIEEIKHFLVKHPDLFEEALGYEIAQPPSSFPPPKKFDPSLTQYINDRPPTPTVLPNMVIEYPQPVVLQDINPFESSNNSRIPLIGAAVVNKRPKFLSENLQQ